MSTIQIARADFADPAVLRLLADHLADMHATSPVESVHALDVDALQDAAVTLWVLREGGDTLGTVALKQLDASHGELKSMRTDAAARGRGLGRVLLAHVLAEARTRGYRRVSLETGTEEFFAPARALYLRAGFVVTEPFGDYVDDPLSVFMTIELTP